MTGRPFYGNQHTGPLRRRPDARRRPAAGPVDSSGVDVGSLPPDLVAVLESAARLQRLVPDAVLVGGTAAALYAAHRTSYDHDHVLTDLAARFDMVEDALDREPDWVLNRRQAGKIILGELGGIETGLRQLIRRRPLETVRVTVPSGATLTVPTVAEIERVKAFLIVKRNQVRDYLDLAALAHTQGMAAAADALAGIDEFYADDTRPGDATPVRDQVIRQLADPRPKDQATLGSLGRYKGLAARWQSWDATVGVCADLAGMVVERSL